MIDEGDSVMVCLSGGKDSYTLLDILLTLRKRAPIDFRIVAMNLDQKQPGFPADVLPNYLKQLGVEYHIETRGHLFHRQGKDTRRQDHLLAGFAPAARHHLPRGPGELGANKIALGHHRDDMIETLFLNMFFGGKLKAMPPKLVTDKGDHIVIRPLAYCPEKDIARYARGMEFPIIPCNLCGAQENLQRQNIKEMLAAWEYSLWLSRKPPDPSHLYGHDKIAFFSAGFEGAMIVLAAFYIVYVSIHRLIAAPKLENLGAGALLVLVAGLVNGALGGYLVWVGKKYGSMILEADGKHVLTDSLTSLGVLVGLSLTILTGWLRFDPMVAILVALDILWMGSKLIRQSIGGLMDEVDPTTQAQIRRLLIEMTSEAGVEFHGLRHRNAGNTTWVEFHLLFPKHTSLESAHSLATKIEERIQQDSRMRTEVTSHLETLEDHHDVHSRGHLEKFDE